MSEQKLVHILSSDDVAHVDRWSTRRKLMARAACGLAVKRYDAWVDARWFLESTNVRARCAQCKEIATARAVSDFVRGADDLHDLPLPE